MSDLIWILVVSFFCALPIGCLYLNTYGKKRYAHYLSCSQCGCDNEILDNVQCSLLTIKCKSPLCCEQIRHPVQPRAFSVFGFSQYYISFACGMVGFVFGSNRQCNFTNTLLIAFAAMLVGGLIIRKVIRIIACGTLMCDVSFAWKEEALSHLAPIIPRKLKDESSNESPEPRVTPRNS